jgi:glyoxylase-like metal-dependent hydrolase (beta-lactamase superfamily II)
MMKIAERIYRLGTVRQPAFVVAGVERIVQIDAGPTFMGPAYLKDLKNLLGDGRGPDWLLFTHLHFDHVGGAPYLRHRFPGLELGGSAKLVQRLARPHIRESLRRLNVEVARTNRPERELDAVDFDFGALAVERILRDREVIELGGGVSIEVMATPGHTRDSTSFYLPHAETVFTGEALGIIPGDDFWVAPQFLSDYHDYLESIERVRLRSPKIIVPGHHGVLEGEAVGHFFDRAVADCRDYRALIERCLLEEKMEQERVVARIKEDQYLSRRKGKQPEAAFLLNLRAQVSLVAGLMMKDAS